MAVARSERRTAGWLPGLLAVFALAGASWWGALGPWGNGGGRGLLSIEECGIRISGSSVMVDTVMPDLVSAFLAQSGYDSVEAPRLTDTGFIGVGKRGTVACTLQVVASSSYEGLGDLASGSARIALAGRPINDRDVARLAAAGAGDFAADRVLAEHVVAIDPVAVIVNRSNSAREISTDQIRDIALGVTRRFGALGGPDGPINLYLSSDGNLPHDFPNDTVTTRHPAFETIGERAKLFPRDRDLMAPLRADPNGLAFLSLSLLPPDHDFKILQVRAGPNAQAPSVAAAQSRQYPIIRRLFLYVRPQSMQDDPFVQRFIAFASSEAGRAIFLRHNFAPPPQTSRNGLDLAPPRCLLGTAEANAVGIATRGAARIDRPLQFEPDSLELTAESKASLDRLAETLREVFSSGGTATLIGHSDAAGEPQRNREVALRRAIAVREALERKGVFGLTAESAGEMCHIAENSTDAGRHQNQRVEIWIRRAATEGTTP